MTIALVGPDGREYELTDPAQLPAAQAQGYRVVTPETPRTLGEQAKALAGDVGDVAKAGAQGLARGLTAGLSDVLAGPATHDIPLPKDSPEYVAAMEGRKKVAADWKAIGDKSPVASVVGEVAGAVLSPLNKVGFGVAGALKPTTALGRVGANIAGGSTVGMLYGAGNTLSEAALGNADVTAERLFANVGLGAVLGGGGAGIGSIVEEGARALVPRIAGRLSKSWLDDLANDSAISATRAQQSVINRMSEADLKAAADALRKRGHLEFSPDEMLKSVQADLQKTGAVKGGFLDAAEAAGKRPTYSALHKKLDDFEGGLNPLERDAIAADLKAARAAVHELGLRPGGSVGKSGSGFRALDDLKQTIQSKAKFSKGPSPLDDVTGGLKRQLAGVFREELDAQLIPALGAGAAKFLESKAAYGALKNAERLATSGTQRAGGIGLKDLLAGNLGGALHPLGLAATIGSKFMREKGPVLVARLADAIAKTPTMSVTAQSFATKLPQAAQHLGQYAQPLLRASTQSPAFALAHHMVQAQVDPQYAQAARVAGFLPETPEEDAAASARAGGLAGVARLMEDGKRRMALDVDKVLRGEGRPKKAAGFASQDFGAQRMRRDDLAAHKRRMEEIQRLSADPDALLERVAANLGGMGDVAPGISAALTRKAHAAVAFLAEKVAVPPKAGPLAPEWVPNDEEIHVFAQTLEVVQDPMSVLQSAAAGTLTETQVDALNAVYPELGREIAETMLERMVGRDVPYRARLMVGMLTGTDPDGSMGAAVAANQAVIQGTSRKPSNAPGEPSGKSPLTLAQRTATPSQREEMREE